MAFIVSIYLKYLLARFNDMERKVVRRLIFMEMRAKHEDAIIEKNAQLEIDFATKYRKRVDLIKTIRTEFIVLTLYCLAFLSIMFVSPNWSSLALGDFVYYAPFLIVLAISSLFGVAWFYYAVDLFSGFLLKRIRPEISAESIRSMPENRISKFFNATDGFLKAITIASSWMTFSYALIFAALKRGYYNIFMEFLIIILVSTGLKANAKISRHEGLKYHAIYMLALSAFVDIFVLLYIFSPFLLHISSSITNLGHYEGKFALKGSAKSLITKICNDDFEGRCGLSISKDDEWLVIKNMEVEFSSSKSLFAKILLFRNESPSGLLYKLELDQSEIRKIDTQSITKLPFGPGRVNYEVESANK